MNHQDFMLGQNMASGEANTAIGKWKSYSDNLKHKLESAQLEIAQLSAREAARDAQQKALREALTKMDPNHPLLRALPQIGNSAMQARFSDFGYSYNPDLETLQKR